MGPLQAIDVDMGVVKKTQHQRKVAIPLLLWEEATLGPLGMIPEIFDAVSHKSNTSPGFGDAGLISQLRVLRLKKFITWTEGWDILFASFRSQPTRQEQRVSFQGSILAQQIITFLL
jgi:hypothetical protein